MLAFGTFVQQKAVGGSARFERGDVCAGAVGAVYRAENRIEALGGLKTLLQVGGGNGPSIADNMATSATPSIGAQLLKKGIGKINFLLRAVSSQRAAGI